MRRRTLVVGNWKMHKTIAQATELVRELLAHTAWQHPGVDVVVAPPFTALAAVGALLKDSDALTLGAQTMHWADQGAYTGAIAAPMLLEVGCRYVILGHSERRSECGETDETVNLSARAALRHGITPIIAVGESQAEHELGRAVQRVQSQVRAALEGIDAADRKRCVFAYEPIWAIGSGKPDSPESANATMGAIRDVDPALAEVQILYGGSVKPNNVAGFAAQPNIDGGLIGGASLEAHSFIELIRNAHPAVTA